MQLQGKSGNRVESNDAGELFVVTESPLVKASRQGKAYSWDSGTRDIDANDTILFVKNLNDAPLFLDQIVINGSNVICEYDLGVGAATTTPSGTAAAESNLSPKNTGAADVTALYDETAVATATVSLRFWTTVAGTAALPIIESLDGYILEKNTYVQVNQVTESTSGSVIIIGHYE
jgi:hypothetical protein|tara:strand:+ start:845 stop:1372 length:528 start_codon:yes stop_codon:yes gene_type:complete